MNTEWKTAILNEIRNDPGVTSGRLNEFLLDIHHADKWWLRYTPKDIYRDLYTLEKQGEITRTDDKPKRCYITTSEPDEVLVVADKVPKRHSGKTFIAGKAYKAIIDKDYPTAFDIFGEDGVSYFCLYEGCAYLDGKNWRKVPKPETFATLETKAFVDFMESEVFDYAHQDLAAKVKELTVWKSNAIAKHPDLEDNPVKIRAREILADHYPHDCIKIMNGGWDHKIVFMAIIEALS